jgi:death on curing protein
MQRCLGSRFYPSIADKAAVYFYNIICNHIFSDGNKRTGLAAALAFLKLNKYRINPLLPQEELYNFTIKVASGESSLEDCQSWFAEHSILITKV